MNFHIYRLVCCLLFLVISLLPRSTQGQSAWQNLVLNGEVDNAAGQKLPGVVLSVKKAVDTTQSLQTVTDSTGKFMVAVGDTGRFLLTAHFLGYEPESRQLVFSGSTSVLTIHILLKPVETLLAAVTVSAKRDAFEMSADKIIVNVSSSALLSSGSVYDILGKTPRVQVDPISKTIRVDGKSGLLFYLDNRQVQTTADQLTKRLEALPANIIERIELITNPSARYDASGGAVLNIITKRSATKGTSADLNITPGFGYYGKLSGTLGISIRRPIWSMYALYTPQVKSTYFHYSVIQHINQPTFTGSIEGNQFRRIDTHQQGIRLGGEVMIKKTISLGANVYAFGQLETTLPVSQTIYFLSNRLTSASTVSAQTILRTSLGNYLANVNAYRALKSLKGNISVDLDYASYQDNSSTQVKYQDQSDSVDNSLKSYFPMTIGVLLPNGRIYTVSN